MFYRDLDGWIDINSVLFSGNASPGHVSLTQGLEVGNVASLGQREEKHSFQQVVLFACFVSPAHSFPVRTGLLERSMQSAGLS